MTELTQEKQVKEPQKPTSSGVPKWAMAVGVGLMVTAVAATTVYVVTKDETVDLMDIDFLPKKESKYMVFGKKLLNAGKHWYNTIIGNIESPEGQPPLIIDNEEDDNFSSSE